MAKAKTAELPTLQHVASDCELVAKAIESVADAAMKVLSGPLTMNALCVLVREQLPYGSKSRISKEDVQDVLEAAAAMSRHVSRKGK